MAGGMVGQMKTKPTVVNLRHRGGLAVRQSFAETRPVYTRTKQTIVEAFAVKAISEQEAIDCLVEMGYKPREAVLYLSFMGSIAKYERKGEAYD
jgi:hypothetical protein